MYDFAEIDKEISYLKQGEKRVFRDSPLSLQGMYLHLVKLHRLGHIDVQAYREPISGKRRIEMITIVKL